MPKIVRSVPANRGIEVAYRRAISKLIDEMNNSMLYWLTAQYKAAPSRVEELAQDASTPSNKMRAKLNAIARRWIKKFNEAAPKIAEAYIRKQFAYSNSAFRQALADNGWTVKFTLTPAMRDALNASINENVALIKSIPEQYFKQVEGIVMRAYTIGRDQAQLVKELKAMYPKTQDRAILIARDQSNKANATVNRTRQLELGITKAVWMHSHAGKTPRPSHVAANGKEFDVANGMYLDGKWIQPGEEINCRCTSRSILPF